MTDCIPSQQSPAAAERGKLAPKQEVRLARLLGRPIPSSLAKYQLVEPAGRDQLDQMNSTAWRRQGRFMVCPDEIEQRDPWLAQALRNLAHKLYGPRPAE
jgi:hypothetical protein